MSFDPTDIGWRLGRSHMPRGVELWCRYDRTCGVFGEQGSGKTLDILAPALLAHRGAGIATLTKLEDLLLTAGRRQVPADRRRRAAADRRARPVRRRARAAAADLGPDRRLRRPDGRHPPLPRVRRRNRDRRGRRRPAGLRCPLLRRRDRRRC